MAIEKFEKGHWYKWVGRGTAPWENEDLRRLFSGELFLCIGHSQYRREVFFEGLKRTEEGKGIAYSPEALRYFEEVFPTYNPATLLQIESCPSSAIRQYPVHPSEVFMPKARQLGMSTLTEQLFRSQFEKYILNTGKTTIAEAYIKRYERELDYSLRNLMEENKMKFKAVSFKDRTTTVVMPDGSLHKAVASEEDHFDPFVGFCIAFATAALGMSKRKVKEMVAKEYKKFQKKAAKKEVPAPREKKSAKAKKSSYSYRRRVKNFETGKWYIWVGPTNKLPKNWLDRMADAFFPGKPIRCSISDGDVCTFDHPLINTWLFWGEENMKHFREVPAPEGK